MPQRPQEGGAMTFEEILDRAIAMLSAAGA